MFVGPSLWTILFSWKFGVFVALAAIGTGLLLFGRVRRWNRAAVLAGAFFLLGGIVVLLAPGLDKYLGMHPSPMCAMTRIAEFWVAKGLLPKMLLVTLGVILLLSLVGKKLFCGWACPLGALQELLYLVPGVKKIPNLPFRFTNLVRTYLLVFYCVGVFAIGVNIYDNINAFELMHWELTFGGAVLGIGVVALAALFYYRPYCSLGCPIGLVSWAVERFSFLAVRLDKAKCTQCKICLAKAPCPVLPDIVAGKTGWLPDCTSCGLCLETCPEKALRFRGPQGGGA